MRKITTVLLLQLITFSLLAQIPAGYYDSANGKTGYQLKTAAHNIIKGHNDRGYSALWTLYASSDILTPSATNSGKSTNIIWDMYSNNPNGTNPYEYVVGSDQNGGSSSGEGDNYNREHSFPKSWFGKASPMVNDGHHIVPTDTKVNSQRGNYPFSEVNATWTSQNGSKRGASIIDGYSGTAFEPIDEFKGDFARIYFYMATRYEDKISSWSSVALDGSSDKVFVDWQLELLKKWNAQDPISQKEITRNNAVHDFQGNRNPFIDNPSWVNEIWGSASGNFFQFSSTPVTSAIINNDYLYNIIASDVNNPDATIIITSETIPSWLTFTNIENGKSKLEGTPLTSDIGEHIVKIKAVQGTEIIYQEFTIIVGDGTDFKFNSEPIVDGEVDSEYTYNIEAIDNNNPTGIVVITAEALPSWLTITDIENGKALLNGTPTTSDIGVHSISLKAVLGGKTIYQNFTITVKEKNNATSYSETFENTPSNKVYTNFNFIGDSGFNWDVIKGRTDGDATMNGKALMLSSKTAEGSLTSVNITGGINSISFDYVNAYSAPGKVKVFVNDVLKGERDVEDKVTNNFLIENLKVTGNYVLKITATGRTIIDNLNWEAYDGLGVGESFFKKFEIYPNPSKATLKINTEAKLDYYKIFSVNGKLVKSGLLIANKINIENLQSGYYRLLVKSGDHQINRGFIRL